MTAVQAISDGTSSGLTGGNMSLFQFGATCWYFAQKLSELGVSTPIGLVNTAIGGQRIEEYMDNSSIATCRNRSGGGPFDGNLFGQQIIPFVDMTVKGWLWYQVHRVFICWLIHSQCFPFSRSDSCGPRC